MPRALRGAEEVLLEYDSNSKGMQSIGFRQCAEEHLPMERIPPLD